MALSRKATISALFLVCIVAYLYKIQIASLFWTGFYQRAIENTNDARRKARLYSFLGEWDKRVEIDEENGFMDGAFDFTYAHVQDGKHMIPFDELLDFLDGIDALSNSGKPQKAMSYLAKYEPATDIEKTTKDRYMKILVHQTELMDVQETYIQLAIEHVEEMSFADDVDPLIYTRYSTLIILLQLCNVIYLWIRPREQKMKRFGFTLVFIFSTGMYCAYLTTTLLTRFLAASTLTSMLEAFIFTPTEAAHRSSPHLERARQLFLKYPYDYDDLLTHQVLGLMTHILWNQLKRCNYPRPDEPYEIRYCKSAYAVAQTIANMLDADESAEDSPEMNFWHQEILMAIEENVEHGVPEFSLGRFTLILTGESTDGGAVLDSEYIRKRMDEWLDDILQDELDDKKQQLSQLEGDEYSFAAVENEL